MGDGAPKLPPAFTLCDDGACGEAKKRIVTIGEGAKQKNVPEVGCEKSEKCGSGGCYCQLFLRREGEKHKDDTWEMAPMDGEGFTHEREKHVYRCLCVKPVLPDGYTLFACGECKQEAIGEGGGRQIKCVGKCPGEANCHLFRIKLPEKDKDHKDPWEHVAEPGGLILPEKGYYYRCFCVKKEEKKDGEKK